MIKNYLQTIRSYKPKLLFTFTDNNSYVIFNGEKVLGSFMDEINFEELVPKYFFILPPKKIEFFGNSVTDNEISNKSLVCGVNTLNGIYQAKYVYNAPQTNTKYDATSLSLQFRVESNNGSNFKIQFESSYIIISINNDETKYRFSSYIKNGYWVAEVNIRYLPKLKDGDILKYSLHRIQNDDIIKSGQYTVSKTYKKTVNDIHLSEFKNLLTVADISVDKEFNDTSIGFNNVFFTYDNNYYEGDERQKIPVLENINDKLFFWGVYHEKLKLVYVENSNEYVNGISNTNTIFRNSSCSVGITSTSKNSARLLINGFNRDNFNESYDIDIAKNKNYNLTISGNQVYLNNKLVAGITGSHNLLSSFSFGWDYTFASTREYIYINTDTIVYLDNIAIFDRKLSFNEIESAYLSSLSYLSLIDLLAPTFKVDFPYYKKYYNNERNSNHRIESYKLTQQQVTGDKYYPSGINFKGTGNLNFDYHSRPSYTNYVFNLVNYDESFTLLFVFKTISNNFILFSEVDKFNPGYGFHIKVIDGVINYFYNGSYLTTNVKVNTGNIEYLSIKFDKIRNKLYTILLGRNVKNELKLYLNRNNLGAYRYVTMINDKGYYNDVDITLYNFMYFDYIIDDLYMDNVIQNNVTFTAEAIINRKNLPANATVRILDYNTGELLDTHYTDHNGTFKYVSGFKNTIKLLIISGNDYITVAPIETETR